MDNPTNNNKIIAILKDRKENLSELLDALQLAQYAILIVQNQQDYVSIIKSARPSSIVIDFIMSEVDVWQVCKKLKSDREIADLPLVCINSSADVANKIIELGWQNVDCLAPTSQPEKTVCLIQNRLLAKNHSPTNSRQNIKLNTKRSPSIDRPTISVDRDIDDFASIVSHDLQAPLRSLTMFAELLTSEYHDELDLKGLEYLQRISNSSDKMQTLIASLQAYSDAGKSEQTWIEVDLKQVCNGTIEKLQPAIARTKAAITIGDLPKILANPREIGRVLHNLLVNAIEFSGDKTPYIEVKATKKEKEWLISVRDNGIGIAEEFQSKIFLAFYKLDRVNDFSGVGMGLAVCQKIVEGYGGTMGVESTQGEGSTFYFTIPVEMSPNWKTVNISSAQKAV